MPQTLGSFLLIDGSLSMLGVKVKLKPFLCPLGLVPPNRM